MQEEWKTVYIKASWGQRRKHTLYIVQNRRTIICVYEKWKHLFFSVNRIMIYFFIRKIFRKYVICQKMEKDKMSEKERKRCKEIIGIVN
jgi:hypothetical protein